MRSAWLGRIHALFLAVLLAGGGSGLPLADALLHHLGPGRSESPLRVHNPDLPAAHGERCTLGVAMPALVRAADLPDGARLARAAERVAGRVRTARPDCATPPTPSLPRAPPAPVA